jgi:hypothetical protein
MTNKGGPGNGFPDNGDNTVCRVILSDNPRADLIWSIDGEPGLGPGPAGSMADFLCHDLHDPAAQHQRAALA